MIKIVHTWQTTTKVSKRVVPKSITFETAETEDNSHMDVQDTHTQSRLV